MKTKQLILGICAFMVTLLASCTDKETVAGVNADGTKTVTFNVTTDAQAQTRTAPTVSGYKLNYTMQVLNQSNETVQDAEITNNGAGSFTVKLPVGVTYTCLFWADYIKEDNTPNEYFTTSDLKAVALKQALTGDEQCQAFCGTASVAADQAEATNNVILKRAVAQVNLRGMATMQEYSKLEASYTNVPNTFNVLTNETSINESAGITHNFTVTDLSVATDANDFTFQSAYFLAPGTEAANMVRIELKTYNSANPGTPIETLTIANVPIKKNYKTNVTGKFKPASVAHTYTIDFNVWEADDFVSHPRIWDGIAATASTSSKFSGGTGTEDDPYIIGKAADLAQLAADVNTQGGDPSKSVADYAGKYFKQTIDIDLNNHEWTPIGKVAVRGSYDYSFKGCYDGNMHKIENLSIKTDLPSAGLFGHINMDSNDVFIKNLHVTGNVTNNTAKNDPYGYGYPYTGGIVGYAGYYYGGYDGIISGCSFDGEVNGKTNVAGICGYLSGFDIYGCANYGNVTGESNVGGIVSKVEEVTNCYNTGTITGQENVGGISGTSTGMAAVLSNCYNIGIVQAAVGYESSTKIGAISGYNDGDGDCMDCYADVQYTFKYSATVNWGNGDGDVNGEVVFGSSVWPRWKAGDTADGTETNGYWKSVGDWNSGTPTYPKLWWEE